MPLKKKYFIILFVSAVLLASCEKTFNTVINIDVSHTPMIAMSLSNSTSDNFIKGAVTETRNITGSPQANTSLINARALIYEDGVLKDSLAYFSADQFFLSHQNNWIANKTYKIVISDNGKETAEATDVMPELIVPTSMIRIKDAKSFILPEYDNQPIKCDEVTIIFNDPPTANNRYMIDFSTLDSMSGNYYQTNYITFDADVETDYDDEEDPTTSHGMKYGTMYLKDQNFNGQQKKIVVYIPHPYNFMLHDSTQIIFNHVSENFYKYTRTFNKYQNAQGNPFSEPVQVFSNVYHGAGIFALQNRKEYVFD